MMLGRLSSVLAISPRQQAHFSLAIAPVAALAAGEGEKAPVAQTSVSQISVPSRPAIAPAKVQEAIAPAPEQGVRIRHIFGDQAFDRQASLVAFTPITSAAPVVFMNYNETLLPPEARSNWTLVGRPGGGPLRPNSASFSVVSSHANGNLHSTMQTGLQLRNFGSEPIKLHLSGLQLTTLFAKSSPSLRKLLVRDTLEIPPHSIFNLPIGEVTPHPDSGNPRDAQRSIVYSLKVDVVGGNPADLGVSDIARFPNGTTAHVTDSGAEKHHEGVFSPQQQVNQALLLGPDNLAYVRIVGSNENHDGHYYAMHRAYVAIPANNPPKTLTFMGPGGITYPEVGGHRLPTIGDEVDDADSQQVVNGLNFTKLKRRREFKLPFAVAVQGGYLTATGRKDSQGNPIYEMDIRFVAGNNGDLGLYGEW